MTGLFLFLASSAFAYDIHTKALTPIVEEAAPSHAPVKLVENGTLNFCLAKDPKTPNSYRMQSVAAILQEAFAKCVGSKPELLDLTETNRLASYRYVVALGKSSVADAEGVDAFALKPQEFVVKTFARGLVLAGYDSHCAPDWHKGPTDKRGASMGTRYAALDFCERFLAVRWYFPGETGSVWPKRRDLTVKPVCYRDRPRFDARGINRYHFWCPMRPGVADRWATYFGDFKRGDASFVDRWKCGGTSFPAGHHCPQPGTVAKAFPGRLHELFYTSPNGKFWYNGRSVGSYWNVFDLTFADFLVEQWKRFYATGGKEDPCGFGEQANAHAVTFGVCDTGLALSDALADPLVRGGKVKVSEKDVRDGTGIANVYGRFYQYLGRRLQKELPGKKLYWLAYIDAKRAPSDPQWILPDNVEVHLCDGRFPRRTRNPGDAANVKSIYRDWYRALGNRPVAKAWLYGEPQNRFGRAIVPEFIADVPKILGETLGRDELFYDFDGSDDLWHYFYSVYCGFRTMWNPDLDIDAALDEMWLNLYGKKAARHVKAFHDGLRKAYLDYFVVPGARGVVPPAVLDTLQRELDAAEKALAGDKVGLMRFRLLADYWPQAFAEQRNLGTRQIDMSVIPRLKPKEKVSRSFAPLKFGRSDGKPCAKMPVELHLAWDEDGLKGLLSFDRLPSAKTEFSCQLQPDPDRSQTYALDFDLKGRVKTAKYRLKPIPAPADTTWKGRGTVAKAFREGQRRGLEFSIPFAALERKDPPAANQTWYANFSVKSGEDHWSTALTFGDDFNAKMYGAIRFEAQKAGFPSAPPKDDPRFADFGKPDGNGISCGLSTRLHDAGDYLSETRVNVNGQRDSGGLLIRVTRPTASLASQFEMRPQGMTGWGNGDSLALTVNGINYRLTTFDPSLIRPWRDGDAKGYEIPFDFAGAGVWLRMFRRPGSRMLHFRLAALENSTVPVKTAMLSIGAVSSGLKIDPKRPGIALFSGYQREIVTEGRVIAKARESVLPTERRFVFRDRELDGTDPKKGMGPALLTVDGDSAVKATALAGGDFYSKIEFDLGDLKKPFGFALWAPNERTSNADFERMYGDIF